MADVETKNSATNKEDCEDSENKSTSEISTNTTTNQFDEKFFQK